jgi:predicted RNA-binding Zn ribbon-like protein
MTWAATERYAVASAPGGLALVQDLLNTIPAGRPRKPDLLADHTAAAGWAADALATWAAAEGHDPSDPGVRPGDLETLTALRTELARLLDGSDPSRAPAVRSAALAVRLGEGGELTLEPRGHGVRRLVAAVLLECFLARRAGTLGRLKRCRYEPCSVAFYDRSRNNSGVWHDVRVCGNAVNLRASRARRAGTRAGT